MLTRRADMVHDYYRIGISSGRFQQQQQQQQQQVHLMTPNYGAKNCTFPIGKQCRGRIVAAVTQP